MFNRRNESGAVSLFIVVFAMLLITIVSISFLRLMLKDQQQASTSDLSQSAYDSALAGAEDAKRALILYRTVCSTDPSSRVCEDAKNTITSSDCNQGLTQVISVPKALDGRNTEVIVQQDQSSTDGDLNQAYTCVLMKLNTDDYLGTLEVNTSKIIPLQSTDDVKSVTVQWYTIDDLGSSAKTVDLIPRVTAEGSKPLYDQARWVASRPSLLRTQLMQFGSDGFTLPEFDTSTGSNSNANTLFLYPAKKTTTTNDTVDFSDDVRANRAGSLQAIGCLDDLAGGGYACTATINLPDPIRGGDRTAFLRLSAFYNKTHFRITLNNQTSQFNAVQPSIDSTGRANDVFRRAESRVDLFDTSAPFPEAAVDLTGNLCKDFSVTADTANWDALKGTCTP